MQAKQFRFRHVNKISGLFLIITFLIVSMAIYLSALQKGWFDDQKEYFIELPHNNTHGLSKGAQVKVMGQVAGNVSDIQFRNRSMDIAYESLEGVDPDNVALVAIIRIKGDYGIFIGSESKAYLKNDLVGIGGPHIDINRSDKKRESQWIELVVEKTISEKAEDLLGRINQKFFIAQEKLGVLLKEDGSFMDALHKVKQQLVQLSKLMDGTSDIDWAHTLENLNLFINDFTSEEGKYHKSFDNFAEMMEKANKNGMIELLGEETAERIRNTTIQINNNLKKIDIEKLSKSIEEIARQAKNVKGENIDKALVKFLQTADTFTNVVDVMSEHWMFRGAFERAGEKKTSNTNHVPDD